jgi:hypothetical protein
MQIKQIDADIVQEAIRVALRLSPPISGNFTLETKENKLYMHSAAELSRCSIHIPCELESDDIQFALPVDALQAATKGRKNMTMVLDNSLLKIKSGKYLVSLTIQDAITQDEDRKTESEILKLTADQMTWLKGAVASVALKPTQNLTTFMPVMVRLTDKSAFVCCVDENHMSFTTTKTVTGDMNVTLPLETITAVLDVFNKIECEIQVTSSALYVRNRFIDVVLALPDAREVIDADIVRDKARESMKMDGAQVELDKKEVTDFLLNARSVNDKSRSELRVSTEPDAVTLMVRTTIGTAKTRLVAKCGGEVDFRIDLEYFEEAVRKSKEVRFKFVGSFIVVYTTDAHVLISLNQED